MLDPHLSELLNGDKSASIKPDDPFEIALDKAVKEEVEALLALEPVGNELLNPELRRTQLELEIRHDPSSAKSKKHTSLAVRILLNEGSQFLEKAEYETLYENIMRLGMNLDVLDLHAIKADAIQVSCTLPADVSEYILKIGISKYDQGLIEESLALFHFLTFVHSQDPDYWFRLGLLAKQCENYPLAISALNTTSDLAPEFIGAHIYAAYCYLKMNSKEEALSELASAKKITESKPIDAEWMAQMNEVEHLLAR